MWLHAEFYRFHFSPSAGALNSQDKEAILNRRIAGLPTSLSGLDNQPVPIAAGAAFEPNLLCAEGLVEGLRGSSQAGLKTWL